MVSDHEEKKEEGERKEEEDQIYLFKATGVRNPEYWQCIRYIAPTGEKKNWRSSDAKGVYCTECKSKINYHSIKNPKGIKRHMEGKHMHMIEEYEHKKTGSNKRKAEISAFFPKKPKTEKCANAVNRQHFNRLVALWTGTSLRPFSVSEDTVLQEMITFATSVSGNLPLPSRNTNRNNLMKEANELINKIRNDIEANCTDFSTTSDMWSSRTMKSFMALTLHFLTEEFIMKSYTLEVKPIRGKHTAELIQYEMQSTFERWGLKHSMLCMMLRDSGSNMVKACSDWNIKHFPCLGHSLHLVVGPFLVIPKNKKNAPESLNDDDNQETQPSSDSEISIGDDDFSFDLHSHSAVVLSDSIEQKNLVAEKLKIVFMQEVQSYLMDIENCGDIDPLVWWRDNRLKYPHVALAARKWLSVTATSTPSERVFSICGVVDIAKRSCMVGESIEKQVFLHNNYYKCQALK